MYYIRRVIGQLVITENREYLRNDYATASWWTKYDIQPGTYQIEGLYSYENLETPYWMSVNVVGVVTDEHFVNRLFNASSIAEKRDIGKTDTLTWQLYGYQALEVERIWEGTVTWSPEYTVRSKEIQGYKDAVLTLAHVVLKENAVQA